LLLSLIGYISAAILLILILVPITNWPMSAFGEIINGDAGLYHYPKAIEMWSTGTAWDLTIPFGDYPFGYESLLSFTLLFAQNISAFDIPHLFIAVFSILGSWFFALKYSRLPSGIILAGIILLILSGLLKVPNPWYFLHHLPYTIGKNDLLLAGATISGILFVPLHEDKNKTTDWIGLGLASGLAISIKPNSALILVFLWVYALFCASEIKSHRIPILISIILAVLGGGWIPRNLITINHLYLPNKITGLTIWSNLADPGFYQRIPTSFLFSLILVLVFLLGSLVKRIRVNLWDVILILFTLLSFMLTPASINPDPPQGVVWRFGLILLFLQFIYLLAVIDPAMEIIVDWITRSKTILIPTSVLILIISIGFVYQQRELLQRVPERSSKLERPYHKSDAEYPSVHDYIDENIHHSVVWIQGIFNYYAYDEKFTNSVTRSEPADYMVIVGDLARYPWFDESQWDLIYDDSEGRIYQNPRKIQE
jgi:hypothetical protein